MNSKITFSDDPLVVVEQMTEIDRKVETALKKLEIEGGPKVEDEPLELWLITRELPFSGLKEATALIKTLEKCSADACRLKSDLAKLSENALEFVDKNSEAIVSLAPEDGVCDVNSVRHEHSSLSILVRTLEQEFDALANEIVAKRLVAFGVGSDGKVVKGRGIDLWAYKTAKEVGKVYIRLRGQLPTYGVDDSSNPSTLFTRTVESIFDAKGISANFRGPSERAVKELKNENPDLTV